MMSALECSSYSLFVNCWIFLALCGDNVLFGGDCWGVALVGRVLVCDVSTEIIASSVEVTSMLVVSSGSKSEEMGMLLLLSDILLILLLLLIPSKLDVGEGLPKLL